MHSHQRFQQNAPSKNTFVNVRKCNSAMQCYCAEERQIPTSDNGSISSLKFINCGLILQFSSFLQLLNSTAAVLSPLYRNDPEFE